MKRALAFASLALISSLLFAGCYGVAGLLSGDSFYGDSPWIISSAEIKPRHPTLKVGDTLQFSMTVTYMDWHDEDKTGVTEWTSSNQQVATIGQWGLVTAIAPGTTQIKGKYRSYSNDTTLTVIATQPSVIKLAAIRGALSFELSSTGREFAYLIDEASAQLAVFRSVKGHWNRIGAVQLLEGTCPWDVDVSPSGRWLVVENRDGEPIAAFAIDQIAGDLISIPLEQSAQLDAEQILLNLDGLNY